MSTMPKLIAWPAQNIRSMTHDQEMLLNLLATARVQTDESPMLLFHACMQLDLWRPD